MFEYLREEIALEDYLVEHPHEREELLLLEDVSGRNEESSDDVDASSNSGKNVNETLLSSNTSLAHSGNLQSYRGRYQEEYQFGAILTEQPKTVTDPEPSPDPEKLMLRPAEEADTNTWSTSDSSDLLF
uniref:Uncharacterized protein n=1 Tax=Arion vulgaris TaxID=1028688 RepID=A0A0B6ZX68_9EUPU